jgi:hypothetical protein
MDLWEIECGGKERIELALVNFGFRKMLASSRAAAQEL